MRSPEGTRLSDIAYMSGSQGRAGLVATKSSRIPRGVTRVYANRERERGGGRGRETERERVRTYVCTNVGRELIMRWLRI